MQSDIGYELTAAPVMADRRFAVYTIVLIGASSSRIERPTTLVRVNHLADLLEWNGLGIFGDHLTSDLAEGRTSTIAVPVQRGRKLLSKS